MNSTEATIKNTSIHNITLYAELNRIIIDRQEYHLFGLTHTPRWCEYTKDTSVLTILIKPNVWSVQFIPKRELHKIITKQASGGIISDKEVVY